MNMVIFGAGASYDAIPSRGPRAWPRNRLGPRLPLAAELFLPEGLFAECLARFPKCKAIVPYLLSPKSGIEAELEKLQREAETYPERTRQLAAVRYYLQDMISTCQAQWLSVAPGGVTNYFALIDELRRVPEKALLVTFNYDCLIENALEAFGLKMTQMQDYTRDKEFNLFKLHGSVDWARQIHSPVDLAKKDGHELVAEVIEMAPSLNVSDQIRIHRARPLAKDETNMPLFPAISIPVETKTTFECPKEHLEHLCDQLGKVTRILIIGWRAAEKHFLALLKQHLRGKVRIEAVLGSDADALAAINQFTNAQIAHVGQPTSYGFSDYVGNHEAERFLNS